MGTLSSGKVGNIIGYAGYIYNPETQLYTVRFRHYDPEWGRWISRDPAGYVDGMSLYGYGVGSPVSLNDPFGLSCIEDSKKKEEPKSSPHLIGPKPDTQPAESVPKADPTWEAVESYRQTYHQ